MKILKLEHELAQQVLVGVKTSTWRLYDDKDLHVGDDLELVDKVQPNDKHSWQIIGTAQITKLVETRLGAVSPDDALGHEQFASPQDMLATYRRYYGPEVTLDTPVKIIFFSFTPLQAAAHFEQPVRQVPIVQQLHEVKLFADGGSRGNPGPSASGFVLLDMHDQVLLDQGRYIGITTNNQAEYLALKLGLEEAFKLGARIVHVYMDSLLVVNQMKNVFKVKNRDLWAVHDSLVALVGHFEKVSFNHVPREYNKAADAAVNRSLDATIVP